MEEGGIDFVLCGLSRHVFMLRSCILHRQLIGENLRISKKGHWKRGISKIGMKFCK